MQAQHFMTLPPVIVPYQSSCGPLQKLGRLQSSNPVLALTIYIWYFLGLNSIVAMYYRTGGNLMWLSCESSIECTPTLRQRSCGPLQNCGIRFGIYQTLIKLLQSMVNCCTEFRKFVEVMELWIRDCMFPILRRISCRPVQNRDFNSGFFIKP